MTEAFTFTVTWDGLAHWIGTIILWAICTSPAWGAVLLILWMGGWSGRYPWSFILDWFDNRALQRKLKQPPKT